VIQRQDQTAPDQSRALRGYMSKHNRGTEERKTSDGKEHLLECPADIHLSLQ
jgi:hypothetical protein